MKWVTHAYAYLDRVASPWLIRRFVDPQAEFVFVGWGDEADAPEDAVPYALGDGELGEHDAAGTTYEKILAKYGLDDPALARIGRIVARGVAYRFNGEPATVDEDGAFALALMAFSEGMLLIEHDDAQVVERSLATYDALYAAFRARDRMQAIGGTLPPSAGRGPTNRTEYLRALLREADQRKR